jgi:hypothetical protein
MVDGSLVESSDDVHSVLGGSVEEDSSVPVMVDGSLVDPSVVGASVVEISDDVHSVLGSSVDEAFSVLVVGDSVEEISLDDISVVVNKSASTHL